MLLYDFLKELRNSKYLKTRDALSYIEFQGIPITIENSIGSIRKGIDGQGKKWKTKFKLPYGYIDNTIARDGDEIDVYIGKNEQSDKVFIVRQHIAGWPDEDKCFLGFENKEQVMNGYLQHMNNPDNLSEIIEIPLEEFRKMVVK